MVEVPIIVISSPKEKSGKTTLALNLAAALWADDYLVNFFATDPAKLQFFLEKRHQLCQAHKTKLPFPRVINTLDEVAAQDGLKQAIIADIAAADNQKYADIFAAAHTLITVSARKEDMNWSLGDPYFSVVWQAKKNAAHRGAQLNWIVVPNQVESAKQLPTWQLVDLAKRYGFRVAQPLHYRAAFQHVAGGYGVADMALKPQIFPMTMADVYARREILTLTDFLWQ